MLVCCALISFSPVAFITAHMGLCFPVLSEEGREVFKAPTHHTSSSVFLSCQLAGNLKGAKSSAGFLDKVISHLESSRHRRLQARLSLPSLHGCCWVTAGAVLSSEGSPLSPMAWGGIWNPYWRCDASLPAANSPCDSARRVCCSRLVGGAMT